MPEGLVNLYGFNIDPSNYGSYLNSDFLSFIRTPTPNTSSNRWPNTSYGTYMPTC
jgi:hypothetical protein